MLILKINKPNGCHWDDELKHAAGGSPLFGVVNLEERQRGDEGVKFLEITSNIIPLMEIYMSE